MHVLIIHRIILEKELFFQEIIDLSCNIPMTYVICMCTNMPVLFSGCIMGDIILSSLVIGKNLKNWWSKLPINEIKPLLIHII